MDTADTKQNLSDNDAEALALIASEKEQKAAIKANTEDIMNLVKDLSEIIERGGRLSANLFGASKDNILGQLQEIGGHMHDVSVKMTNKTPTENAALALQAAQKYVREHPVQALGVALGAGYLLSHVLKAKNDDDTPSQPDENA